MMKPRFWLQYYIKRLACATHVPDWPVTLIVTTATNHASPLVQDTVCHPAAPGPDLCLAIIGFPRCCSGRTYGPWLYRYVTFHSRVCLTCDGVRCGTRTIVLFLLFHDTPLLKGNSQVPRLRSEDGFTTW